MSKVLESLKVQVDNARHLSYYGNYKESVTEFDRVIEKMQTFMQSLTDRNLISEWKKCFDEMKYQRALADSLSQLLQANFEPFHRLKKHEEADSKASQRESRLLTDDVIERKQQYPFGKQPFKAHEDDQLYNRRQREDDPKRRAEEERKIQEDKAFEEREKQIWPQKKPVANMKKQNNAGKNNKPVGNGSAVGNKEHGRQYQKPWQKNVKKKESTQEKKTYMKHCYPDGQGPDAGLIQMLEKQVIQLSPDVKFQDIAQLDQAKQALQETVFWPMIDPSLFQGVRSPWKGVLLYGPPGTGKTLLAKAVATGKTAFFSLTASSLASKWKGQSQKLVRILFDMAKFYAPATIFIDEIDALAGKRGDKEDESSRKVKTELMARIDGATTGKEGEPHVVVIGATNRPWDLDEAIRRRLQKRIYIPLPTEKGRGTLIRLKLKGVNVDQLDFQELIDKTQGFSGADINNLCKEAAYIPIRKMRKIFKEITAKGRDNIDEKDKEQLTKGGKQSLKMEFFNQALRNIKPSVGKDDLIHFQQWTKKYGQIGTD